jgi:hypothetical protein
LICFVKDDSINLGMFDKLNLDVYPDSSLLPLEWNAHRFTPQWAATPKDVPEWDPTRGGKMPAAEDRYLFDGERLMDAWAEWRKLRPDVVIPDAPPSACPRLVVSGTDWPNEGRTIKETRTEKEFVFVRGPITQGFVNMSDRTMTYDYEAREKTFTYTNVSTRNLIRDLSRIWNNQERGFFKDAEKGILELASEFSPYAASGSGIDGLTRDSWLIYAQRVYVVLSILECLEHEDDAVQEMLQLIVEGARTELVGDRLRLQQAWQEVRGRLEYANSQGALTPRKIKNVLIDYCIWCAGSSQVSLSSMDGIPKFSVVSGTGQWAMFLLARHVQKKSGGLTVRCNECGTPIPSSARGQPLKWCSDACEIKNRRKRNDLESATTEAK